MLEFFLISRFVSSVITLLVGVGLVLLIRKKAKRHEENSPVGFWMRALCFGTDLAVIDIINLFVAYHGDLRSAGYISALITFSYFFFFWLFFSSTPAAMFARVKVVSKDNAPLKVWQALARLGMSLVLFVGWVTMVFDKKEKKTLHDIVARTKVVYTTGKIQLNIKEGLVRVLQFGALGAVIILIASLMYFGPHEKMAGYAENSQVSFFDLNRDKIPEGLTIDLDNDGKPDVFKYDLNNDRVIELTTFDADKDGVAESVDANNDGRIDGFDFDNDNVLDIKVFGGQFFIWLWRAWFGLWTVGFVGLLAFTIMREERIKH